MFVSYRHFLGFHLVHPGSAAVPESSRDDIHHSSRCRAAGKHSGGSSGHSRPCHGSPTRCCNGSPQGSPRIHSPRIKCCNSARLRMSQDVSRCFSRCFKMLQSLEENFKNLLQQTSHHPGDPGVVIPEANLAVTRTCLVSAFVIPAG